MQPDLDLVRARRLDRVGHEDLPAVELRAAGGADRFGDVGRAHRAEQPAVRAGPALEADGQPLQLAGHGLRVLEGADLARRAGPLDQVNLLLAAARPRDREAAGQQVVTAVASGHVHYVTRSAEAADLLGQDQLHARHWSVLPCPSEPCWCTGAAPSRARS